jgi:DNA-binding NtrC family response regulator
VEDFAMGRITILCIDDDALVLSAMKDFLELKGYAVITAASGESALDIMSQRFDAAVLDYDLPDVNAEKVARCLKAVRPQLPIVLFSGYPDIPESTLREVTAFVPKGNGFSHLLTTLAGLIREAS